MLDAQKNRGKLRPYLANPNVRWFDVDLIDLKEMRFEDAEEEKFSVRDGDVLICEGGEAGRAAVWNGPDIGVKFQKAIHRVRTGPQLLNRYLVHLLFYDYHSGGLDDYYTGATIHHLTGQDLARYEFPLPPLDEQRRIAAILDQADDLRRKRREALTLLGNTNKAIFLEMFGDPSANVPAWPTVQFGDVGTLDRGVSKHRPRNDPTLLGGKYPLIQTGEVTNSDGYIREFGSTYSELGLRQSRLWPKGTLCITIAANIGKTGILTFDACFPDSVVGFVPGNGVRTEFVQQWLAFVQPALERDAPQFAQKNINLAILRDLPFLSPPFHLQSSFADRVIQVDWLKAHHRAHLAKLDALFASLQHRAFRGEL
jgi:type I restriction enzyme S subunit